MIIANKNVPPASDWCFLIGFARTGSSVMVNILNAHSQIRILYEAWLWGYCDILQRSYFSLSLPNSGMYRAAEYYGAQMPSNIGVHLNNYSLVNGQKADGENQWDALALRKIMEGFKQGLSSSCQIFGDKKWYYRDILTDLLKVFPDCKLILTTRNKWDLAASSLGSQYFKERRPDLSSEQLAVLALERAEKQKELDETIKGQFNVFEIKFEDMASNSQKRIEEALDYLNLSSNGFNWDILKTTHYDTAMNHWERIAELVELRKDIE